MFLITTAEEKYWDTGGRVLFLGHWCLLHSKKHIWDKLDYEVLPYHWDTRDDLYKDHIFLDKVYESTLANLSNWLNYIHGVKYDTGYWRIIIGRWLFQFVQILYDRYKSIDTAYNTNNVSNTYIGVYDRNIVLPKNTTDFHKICYTDSYNHYLYSKIISYLNKIPYKVKDFDNYSINNSFQSNINQYNPISLKKLHSLIARSVPDKLNKIVLFLDKIIQT